MVKSFSCALICFLTGILIDIDHLFEYIKDVGWNLNLKQFFKFCYETKYERLYLLLYGRPPAAHDIEIGQTLLAGVSTSEQALEQYCQLLLCASEFVYID